MIKSRACITLAWAYTDKLDTVQSHHAQSYAPKMSKFIHLRHHDNLEFFACFKNGHHGSASGLELEMYSSRICVPEMHIQNFDGI
jgi:hypothetical protein